MYLHGPQLCTAVLTFCWRCREEIKRGTLKVEFPKCHYYSFCSWLAKIPDIIHHNQLLSTKFGRILRYWTDDVKSAAKLRVNEPLTEKTWGLGWVVSADLNSPLSFKLPDTIEMNWTSTLACEFFVGWKLILCVRFRRIICIAFLIVFCFAGESAGRLSPVSEMELETGIWSRITLSVLVNLMTKKFILTTKNESKTSCTAYNGSYKNTFFHK